jgi:protease-4
MAGKPVIAERTTMTGSIGVFASFPNVEELSKKIGFTFETIKQGNIKDSGSPFKKMSAKEEQVWQDLVDTAYNQFVSVVEMGRPNLKGKMLEPITMHPVQAGPPNQDKKKPTDYQRYRADGGVFTADKAREYGLVDQIGYLDEAVKEAKKVAGLGDSYKAVDYERPKGVLGLLVGADARASALLDPARLSKGLWPRLWYLAPGCELTGILAATESE